jgi:hypothetical protein
MSASSTSRASGKTADRFFGQRRLGAEIATSAA